MTDDTHRDRATGARDEDRLQEIGMLGRTVRDAEKTLLAELKEARAARERQHAEIVAAIHTLCAAVDEDVARADPPKVVMAQMIEIARQQRARLAEVEAQRAALVEALSKYGDHRSQDCAPMYGCRCGLVDVLAAERRAEGEGSGSHA